MDKAEPAMRLAFVIVTVCLFALVATLMHGVSSGNFNMELRQIVSLAWGKATLVDIYIGFILFSIWVWYREQQALVAVLWITALMLLGNLIACIYILQGIYRSGFDSNTFWKQPRLARS